LQRGAVFFYEEARSKATRPGSAIGTWGTGLFRPVPGIKAFPKSYSREKAETFNAQSRSAGPKGAQFAHFLDVGSRAAGLDIFEIRPQFYLSSSGFEVAG
jgi:hypothetical protein